VDSLDLLRIPELAGMLVRINDRLITTCSVEAPGMSGTSLGIVAAGGKRLRPALTVSVAGLGGAFDARVVAAAVAVELVQIGSLVHDDLFDQALTRRGAPTVNAVEGDSEALLAGTYLMARAAAEASSAGQRVASDVAGTLSRLCLGQATETVHLFDVEQAIDRYLLTIESKTAALFACSCRVGALCADLPEADLRRLSEFGRNFGMAFQLIDDVLDLIGDPALLGKPVGTDIQNGVLTLPVLLGLADPRAGDLRALLLSRQRVDLDQVSQMTVESGRVDETIEMARRYARTASAEAAAVNGTTEGLTSFPEWYIDWALEEFVAA
jgi:heptaprenyl diphosphate synthase